MPEFVEQALGSFPEDDVSQPDPPQPFRIFPVPPKDRSDEIHDLFFGKKGRKNGSHQRVSAPLAADPHRVPPFNRLPRLTGADLETIAAIDAPLRCKERLVILSLGDGAGRARLDAQSAAYAGVEVQSRQDGTLKTHIIRRRFRTIERTAGKGDLEFVMAGIDPEEPCIHFEGRLLGVHQSVGIVFATAAGHRDADTGAAGSDLLLDNAELFPDGADVKIHDEVLFIDENTARITVSLTEDLGEYVPEPTVLEAQQAKLIVPFDQDKQYYSTDELPEIPADFVVDDSPPVEA